MGKIMPADTSVHNKIIKVNSYICFLITINM